MGHQAIEQVLARARLAKSDSDFTYFSDLLLAAEALGKLIAIGMLTAISDDKDRNRYRIEHQLVRADGLGDWARAIEDVLTGTTSQFLLTDAYTAQAELTRLCKPGDWQYEAVRAIKNALDALDIEAEEVPAKSDMKRWFRLLAVLRNKTKAHGAPRSSVVATPATELERSIQLVYKNFSLFECSWAYLHRNLSGKYNVSVIAGTCSEFSRLKSEHNHTFPNGVYTWWGGPRTSGLIRSSLELNDFYFANGGYGGKKYELMSYYTGDRQEGDSSEFSTPPGVLPPSQTTAHGELIAHTNCLSNAPDLASGYVERRDLEHELLELLLDDRRHIVTLRGKGGIGKTSLALKVLEYVYSNDRFMTVIWLSARDVDLQISGPVHVRPDVVSPEDIGKLYAELVLSPEKYRETGFDGRRFFEEELHDCSSGPCLFVFDNFETTQNPVEMYAWIDTYVRLPNKVLITTRLRDFKGDYPVDVHGMTEDESRILATQTSKYLGISELVTSKFINDVIQRSEGHPYVIKVLLGETAKNRKLSSVPHLVAGSEDILTALFERTYAALSPCAQRAFLTLSAWSSSVPRLALEAVLLKSTKERHEVEQGVDMLIQYSLAESHLAPADEQEFLAIPLVAATFGKKKLNISPYKSSVQGDLEILQMLGPSRRDDIHLGLQRRLENFISGIANRVDAGASFEEFEPILEMICRNYPLGWLIVARWHLETDTLESLEKAKHELRLFLETEPHGQVAGDAWRNLAFVCHRTGDTLGEVHAFIERAQIANVPFYDVSNSANKLNTYISSQGGNIDKDEKQALAQKLLSVLEARIEEADADDLSRMAWLAIHLGQEGKALDLVGTGLKLDPNNSHCQKLATRLDS